MEAAVMEQNQSPPAKGEALIELKHIYKIYYLGGEEIRASDDVSLTICRGEFVAIVGKSGSGKSTLMNIIGALDVPSMGEYYLGGEDVSDMTDKELAHIRNKMIGFIFQQYNLLPKLNILENVELPLLYRGIPRAERRQLSRRALQSVGLENRLHHLPSQMSGGQQQRVAIARAISTRAPIIMADEPTGALDSKTGRHVLEILHGLHDEGTTVILITHDNKIAATAERIVRISDGKIVQDCPREEAEL